MRHLSLNTLWIVAALALPALAACSREEPVRSPGSEVRVREEITAEQAAAGVWFAAPGEPSKGPSVPSSGLVVHEWGTFTSMQGAGGVSLDGLHHEEEELPGFVHSNVGASVQSPFRAYGDHSLDRPARRVNSKMETPVIYFYTKEKRRVTVRVDYDQGLLTQWYPAASRALPELPRASADGAAPTLDIGRIQRSTLEWELDLLPDGAGAAPSIPAVSTDNPWHFAREVKAAFVTAVPPAGSSAPAESERYVFYRGLGRLAPPLQVMPLQGGKMVVQNRGVSAIAAAFVLQMQTSAAGVVGRAKRIDANALPANSGVMVSLEGKATPRDELVASLSREVQATLVEQGLFEDEARAMVRTWAPTWFASEGTRVIYVVPRPIVDTLLPLEITPAPSTLTRVLVARHEVLTLETQSEVAAALRARLSSDAAARERATKQLAKLGRFIEPAVRNAIVSSSDTDVRRSGTEVLSSFR